MIKLINCFIDKMKKIRIILKNIFYDNINNNNKFIVQFNWLTVSIGYASGHQLSSSVMCNATNQSFKIQKKETMITTSVYLVNTILVTFETLLILPVNM